MSRLTKPTLQPSSIQQSLDTPRPMASFPSAAAASATPDTQHNSLALSPNSRNLRLKQILEEHRADRARITQRTRSLYDVSRHGATAKEDDHVSDDKLQETILELSRIEREVQSIQRMARARRERLITERNRNQRLNMLQESVGINPRRSLYRDRDNVDNEASLRIQNNWRPCDDHVQKHCTCSHSNCSSTSTNSSATGGTSTSTASLHISTGIPAVVPPAAKKTTRSTTTTTTAIVPIIQLKPAERELRVDQLVDATTAHEHVKLKDNRKQRSGSIRAGLKWLDVNNRGGGHGGGHGGGNGGGNGVGIGGQYSSRRSVSSRINGSRCSGKENDEQRRSTRLLKSISQKWSNCF